MISLLSKNQAYSYRQVCDMPRPDFLDDLQLGYFIEHVISFRENPEIEPYFHWMAESFEDTIYRQEVFKDLKNPAVRESILSFIIEISNAVRFFSFCNSVTISAQKWKWQLDGIVMYYQALENLCSRFNENPPKSQAFYQLHRFFYEILCSEEVVKLREKANALNAEFSSMSYRLIINKDRATLIFEGSGNDYCFPVRDAFYKGNANPDPVYFDGSPFSSSMELSPLEEFILKQYQKKNRVLFRDLETFCGISRDIVDENILDVVRELRFYLSVAEYEEHIEEKGYPFSVPQIVENRELFIDDCYDVALAIRYIEQKKEIVYNDIMKAEFEKAIIVTGPNQGGKTTLARAFGQAFYLGMMGFCVPGRLSKLPFVNQIFTLFSSENVKMNVESRLQGELHKIKNMIMTIGSQSIVIMNELFTSAPTMDALSMNRELMHTLIDQYSSICFCVTHTYEFAGDSDDYVSLVATVVEDGSYRRTFRLIRREANGIAYANSIAEKYKLDYSHINYRIQKNGV